jgi:hypothetical protein
MVSVDNRGPRKILAGIEHAFDTNRISVRNARTGRLSKASTW